MTHFIPDPQPVVAKKPKRGLPSIAQFALVTVVATVIGVGIGYGAGKTADAEPAPAVTVTAEPAEPVVDIERLAACQRAASELKEINLASINEATLPYGEVTEILYSQLLAVVEGGPLALSTTEIERGTAILEEITASSQALTQRITDVSGDYTVCMG